MTASYWPSCKERGDAVQLDLTGSRRATIDALAKGGETIQPKDALVDWAVPWNEVLHWKPPKHQWFLGGKLNATVDCIDRHAQSERRNKAAILWVGENGEEHAYTYARLYREVNRFANALEDLGVGVGDRVILYMPLVPEGIVTMLACARIGAFHSVVYAGMRKEALRARVVDAGAKVVVCSDDTYRRGKAIDLKRIVDDAVRELIACAGEPLNPEAHRWAQKHLVSQSDGMVVDNWWQTEIAGPVLGTLPSFEGRLGKVGKVMPGVRAEVVSADGTPVPAGSGGLLVIRDPLPYMMRTVWNDPDRYAEYWKQIPGCYSAGDVAVRDADGYFAVLGRADDVMNVAGHRISTADVESSLLRHPAVAESAVIGLPDELKGERIKAYVVLRPGVKLGTGVRASIKDHVREDLGPIAQPSEIEVVNALPKTRSGKIVRRYLKAQALGEDPGDLSTLAD